VVAYGSKYANDDCCPDKGYDPSYGYGYPKYSNKYPPNYDYKYPPNYSNKYPPNYDYKYPPNYSNKYPPNYSNKYPPNYDYKCPPYPCKDTVYPRTYHHTSYTTPPTCYKPQPKYGKRCVKVVHDIHYYYGC
jgi:hypothetical protein